MAQNWPKIGLQAKMGQYWSKMTQVSCREPLAIFSKLRAPDLRKNVTPEPQIDVFKSPKIASSA